MADGTEPPTRKRAKASILRSEIMSQPQVLARILSKEQRRIEKVAAAVRRFDPQLVLVVARGSADNAGLYGKYLFGAHNRTVVALATPSLITRYGKPPDLGRALVLGISQSGQSFDVVETVQAAREAGAFTVAITNSPNSPLAESADEVLLCHAGVERSVAATKTYTAQLMLLALLSTHISGNRRRLLSLEQVPDHVAAALECEPAARDIAQRLRYLEQCAVVGRGFSYGTAFEVALKLGELTHVVAQPYSAADFRHGPIAVVDQGFCVVLLAPRGKVLTDINALLTELRDREAEVIAISDVSAVLRGATRGLRLPGGVPEWLAPLTCVVPGQLLAMYLAQAKGLPLDAPRGLRKVTRTR
jgi:glucosamine--fructose-6-phosphate aminotransferase (isomerizing)